MNKFFSTLWYKISGIAGCFLDLFFQILISMRLLSEKEPEWDDTEEYLHK